MSGVTQELDVGCTVLHLQAIRQGNTEVIVTYQATKVVLTASITIAAYNPLKVKMIHSSRGLMIGINWLVHDWEGCGVDGRALLKAA